MEYWYPWSSIVDVGLQLTIVKPLQQYIFFTVSCLIFWKEQDNRTFDFDENEGRALRMNGWVYGCKYNYVLRPVGIYMLDEWMS